MKHKILFPEGTILKTKLFTVAQDWEVPIKGFYVIAPKRKIHSVEELTDEESKELIILIKKVRQGMRNVLGIKEVYIFQAEGGKFPFHVCMFPIHSWMKKNGKWIGLILPSLIHAKKNMANEKTIKEVNKAVEKMRGFMKKKGEVRLRK